MTISFLINLVVLGVVVPAIVRDTPQMVTVYGPRTPARGIVVAFYGSVMAFSTAGLILLALGSPLAHDIGLMLLPVQVLYKGLTVITVGPANPVIRANVAIAAWHLVTCMALYD
ncbi:MAG: hypothetical protein AAF801_10305 [Pseudomonadota bacterium]